MCWSHFLDLLYLEFTVKRKKNIVFLYICSFRCFFLYILYWTTDKNSNREEFEVLCYYVVAYSNLLFLLFFYIFEVNLNERILLQLFYYFLNFFVSEAAHSSYLKYLHMLRHKKYTKVCISFCDAVIYLFLL